MTRAAVAVPSPGLRRAALAVLTACLVFLAGCREEAIAPPDGSPPRIALPRNARYRYTIWQLDRFGAKIPGSNAERRWVVRPTGADTLGYSNVTLVDDSSGRGRRTIAFRFTPGGDIYQFGYLADLVERLEGRTIEPEWNLITAYSRGWSSSWTVGALDSGATETMAGSSSEEELFFTATVNGVPTVVAGYPVVLSSRLLETVLWVSENPPAFLRLREERYPALGGRPGTLGEVTVIANP